MSAMVSSPIPAGLERSYHPPNFAAPDSLHSGTFGSSRARSPPQLVRSVPGLLLPSIGSELRKGGK
jgi:hypothetical protein